MLGASLALMERFDAEGTLANIERHRGTVVYLVPTMMKRIWRLPEEVRERYDLSSLRVVWHLAEPCPEWLKQCWIDWLGAERIFELYAGTEAQTATIISGPEWLAHRGSVGRPRWGNGRRPAVRAPRRSTRHGRTESPDRPESGAQGCGLPAPCGGGTRHARAAVRLPSRL